MVCTENLVLASVGGKFKFQPFIWVERVTTHDSAVCTHGLGTYKIVET